MNDFLATLLKAFFDSNSGAIAFIEGPVALLAGGLAFFVMCFDTLYHVYKKWSGDKKSGVGEVFREKLGTLFLVLILIMPLSLAGFSGDLLTLYPRVVADSGIMLVNAATAYVPVPSAYNPGQNAGLFNQTNLVTLCRPGVFNAVNNTNATFAASGTASNPVTLATSMMQAANGYVAANNQRASNLENCVNYYDTQISSDTECIPAGIFGIDITAAKYIGYLAIYKAQSGTFGNFWLNLSGGLLTALGGGSSQMLQPNNVVNTVLKAYTSANGLTMDDAQAGWCQKAKDLAALKVSEGADPGITNIVVPLFLMSVTVAYLGAIVWWAMNVIAFAFLFPISVLLFIFKGTRSMFWGAVRKGISLTLVPTIVTLMFGVSVQAFVMIWIGTGTSGGGLINTLLTATNSGAGGAATGAVGTIFFKIVAIFAFGIGLVKVMLQAQGMCDSALGANYGQYIAKDK